jgi:hypothetical protein
MPISFLREIRHETPEASLIVPFGKALFGYTFQSAGGAKNLVFDQVNATHNV